MDINLYGQVNKGSTGPVTNQPHIEMLYTVVKLGGIPGDLRSPTSDFRPTSFYAEIRWILCLLKCTI